MYKSRVRMEYLVFINETIIKLFTLLLYFRLDASCDHVEGGIYIGPEFLLGQVYDGDNQETVVIYRPVYIAVRKPTANVLPPPQVSGTSTPKSGNLIKAISSSTSKLNSL